MQRAKLTSSQLPMYYVGWRGWIKASATSTGRPKAALSAWRDFNDRALKEGAVPLPALGALLKYGCGRTGNRYRLAKASIIV